MPYNRVATKYKTQIVSQALDERCSNPWNDECKNSNIAVYIYYKGEKLPICRSCWKEIADSDLEWISV